MEKELIFKVLSEGVTAGADFGEVYYEDKKFKRYIFEDSKLDDVRVNYTRGAGIRLACDNNVAYVATNDLSEDNLLLETKKLALNFDGIRKIEIPPLKLEENYFVPEKNYGNFDVNWFKDLCHRIDKQVRDYSEFVTQVTVMLDMEETLITVAATDGTYVKFNNLITRIIVFIYGAKGEVSESQMCDLGGFGGLEIVDEDKILEKALESVKTLVEKLDSVSVKGGYYPVILSGGFCGTIFHEACGHGLEASAVAYQKSVFYDKLGQKVASSKVTLIDDGTLKPNFGYVLYDSEGHLPQKNVLIENGILKGFLIDKLNGRKMGMESTGSGRREDYLYAPTSRMNNTYLAAGNDTFEEMVASIDYGFYCKNLNGGIVEPGTGDFNFNVSEAFLIENGKITKRVKGISLIGNSLDILQNVEMVGSNLWFGNGVCSAGSGYIYNTVGQPEIKVSKILVGGMSDE